MVSTLSNSGPNIQSMVKTVLIIKFSYILNKNNENCFNEHLYLPYTFSIPWGWRSYLTDRFPFENTTCLNYTWCTHILLKFYILTYHCLLYYVTPPWRDTIVLHVVLLIQYLKTTLSKILNVVYSFDAKSHVVY